MFHPDFPPQEPYFDVPYEQHGKRVGKLHMDVAAALNRSLASGFEPSTLGLRFAELLKNAIERRPNTEISDSIGVYERLLSEPINVLKILSNTFLVDDGDHLGHIAGPA